MTTFDDHTKRRRRPNPDYVAPTREYVLTCRIFGTLGAARGVGLLFSEVSGQGCVGGFEDDTNRGHRPTRDYVLDWRIPSALGALHVCQDAHFSGCRYGLRRTFFRPRRDLAIGVARTPASLIRTRTEHTAPFETTCWTGGFPVPWVLRSTLSRTQARVA